ncbi:open rectifier K[+] channel 1 isoform X4 [Nomia melanderi]|uniref:open rectifier K[+] channel 1 isoform X4 n=3 Tax=Nomia melanderi TaxID=2448451 RepID=UPI001304508F|nr:open rectifier potassium channel protein 1 isoform X3 [Nomia melanderi]
MRDERTFAHLFRNAKEETRSMKIQSFTSRVLRAQSQPRPRRNSWKTDAILWKVGLQLHRRRNGSLEMGLLQQLLFRIHRGQYNRLREFGSHEYAGSNLDDILRTNRHTYQRNFADAAGRILRTRVRESAREIQVVQEEPCPQRLLSQETDNVRNEKSWTGRTNIRLLDARLCDVYIFPGISFLSLRRLELRRSCVLRFRYVNNHRFRGLCGSKKITRIEHKLATNLKHTQSKIWNEFNKEINYLRRVFNELQLSKVKRVYVDECHYEVPRANFPRSNSFPDLRDVLHGEKGYECFVRQRPRRRANSEVVPKEDQLGRVVSETDLQRIDKTATFASHAMVQPAELLARLVNILGYMPPAIDDIGGDCSNQTTFVQQDARRNSRIDDEIRQKVPNDISEKESTHARGSGPGGWTIGPSDRIPRFPRLRSRATSEIRLHETKKNEDRHAEWTWSGATASKTIQELMKARAYESSTKESSAKDRAAAKEQKFSTKLRSFSLAKSVPKALISSGPWKHRFSISTEKKNSDSERNGNSKDLEASFVPRETSSTRRDSDVNYASRRNYYTHTGAPNNHSERESSNLLEETSLADFVRALSFLHASVATTGNWAAAAATPTAEDRLHETRPRRKMGTASLSPPKLPSLFTLFSSNPVPSATAQANNRPVTTQPSCRDTRRGSLAFGGSTVQKSRRFSLRPVATPISPPTPPRSGSPFLPESRRTSYENKSSFLSESPKEPLIRTEDGPGFSPPMVPPSALNNARRFSLRPIQNRIGGTSTEETAASVATTLKAVPRWKSGMLQRQIGQKNLRRRVRAFSLSDVHVDDVREKVEETKSSSATRERSDSETVDESTSSRRERSTGGDQLFVTPTEHDHRDRHVSSIEPTNERYTPFSRVASTTTRLDDKTVRIADPCSRLIDRYTASNESPLCQQKIESTRDRERDRFVPVQSVTFGSFQNATVNPPINLDRKQAPLVATTDATSQHPLEQVKIETPPTTTTTFHSSFPNTNANTLSDNFLRLTEVKTEEQASRSYRDRKF